MRVFFFLGNCCKTVPEKMELFFELNGSVFVISINVGTVYA